MARAIIWEKPQAKTCPLDWTLIGARTSKELNLLKNSFGFCSDEVYKSFYSFMVLEFLFNLLHADVLLKIRFLSKIIIVGVPNNIKTNLKLIFLLMNHNRINRSQLAELIMKQPHAQFSFSSIAARIPVSEV